VGPGEDVSEKIDTATIATTNAVIEATIRRSRRPRVRPSVIVRRWSGGSGDGIVSG
jgi:hypothetical protein